MSRAWMAVIVSMWMVIGCTNELAEEDPPPQEEETGWEPGEVDNGVKVDPGDSCIGLQENPANEDFSPICESLFLSEDFKAENGSCLILDDKPDQPCFCKICGVKGGGDTMKFLCLKVVCQ